MKLERQSTGQKIDISSLIELGAGGEARVFILGRTGLAAKVYHKATAEHAAKLAAMLANPPVDPMANKGHVSIAWPSDLLLSCDRHRKVLGYLMPLVTELDPIINFYNTKTRKSQHPLFSYCYLLRTARNLASSMCALHARGYVVGDINESNILVSETALVTLVDTDSFQVPDKANGKIYRCNVGKPEFTPPELQNTHFASVERTTEHDQFGLAVLIFQMLMEGNHPFDGRFTGRGETPSIAKCIANGYFPYAENPCGFYEPRQLAPPFEILPPALRHLFLVCFENGHSQPEKRPDAKAWQEALTEAENRLVICQTNKQHQYGEHLSGCPWCERSKEFGGVDPFPSQLAVKQGTHTHKPNVVQVPLPSPSGGYVRPVAPRSAVAASRPNPARQATAALRAATPARKSNPWLVRAVLFIILILVVFFEGRSLYRSYLANTTLSFGITVDGKDLPAGSTPEIQVDGQPFANGNQIGLGSHELKVALKDAEPFSEKFWIFGAKSLGPLPLESSKGSLSVTVNPSPATVELKRDGVLVRQGNAPLNMDKLSVGSYAMIVHRGDYSETYAITIHRAQATKGQIDLDLGSAELSASPPDAEYDLSGNGRQWQGKLPVKLPEVPGGNYTLTVTRKGWPLTKTITISRANLTTDKIEFPYGSIAVTSDPPGMNVSTGGVDLGKTPTTLRELKPGQYVVSVTDGENDLVSVVNVDPKESASHNFVFHYGSVQLSSTPPGATVIRKGKVVGTTPLTLEHIPTETTAVTLRLEDFATVNVPIRAETGFTTNFAVKLFSNRYVAAMDAAKQALAANEFDSARQSVATAITLDPNDPVASALLTEINRQAEIWHQQQVEAARLAAEAKARQLADELAAIPALNPDSIIQSCWHTPGKSDPAFSKPVSIEAGKQNPAALPVWIATDVIVKGIEIIAWPFHKSKKEPRFDQGYFVNKYQNNVYRYFGKITNVDAKNKTITFAVGGKSKQSFVVTTHFQNEVFPAVPVLKPGLPVWVSGQLIALVEANPANRLFLDNGTTYSPTTLPAPN